MAGHAGSANTLIIYIAAHGYYNCADEHGVPVNSDRCAPERAEPFILTTNTSPDGPRETGLPMRTIESLVGENAYRFGRVLAFIDVCHAHVYDWKSGRTDPPPVPPDAIKFSFEAQKGATAVMMASSQDSNHEKELSYESAQLQHGIFTYFVVDGLGGGAESSGDVILFRNLYQYVDLKVENFTGGEQIPSQQWSTPRIAAVNDAHALRYAVPPPDPAKSKFTARSKSPRRDPLASPLPPASPAPEGGSPPGGGDAASRFELALKNRRLLPGEPDDAFDAFQEIARNASEADLKPLRDRLRIALEDAGQRIMILYLQGDQVPQARADFERGRRLFEAALALAPAAAANESRMLFCAGRVKVFDKQYAEGQKLLEQSINLDPLHGYAYNALGIALLEQIPNDPGNLAPAIQAFHDAAVLEPMWAYPLHNLALAYAQQGDNGFAIDTYQAAMRIAPAYSYLPYNLGLLYERLNAPQQAEKNFDLALKRAEARAARLGVSPDRWGEKAAPLNALGTLYFSEGRLRAASRQFELALKADPKYVPALHNTGIILAARGRKAQAVQMWRGALAEDPDFTAARVSLAQTLLETRDFDHAALEFGEILRRHPDYAAARRSRAEALFGLCRDRAALDELNRAATANPASRDLAAELDDLTAVNAGQPPKTGALRRIRAERTCP